MNLASRAENLTKFYGVGIIVTEYTRKASDEFIFRKLDKVNVRGKSVSVEIYELMCLKNDLTIELSDEIEKHNQALNLYFQQKWNDALTLFEILYREHPDTYIYKLFIDRINGYKVNPPVSPWDGSFVLRR